jgi:hypothetical protein
MLITLISAGLGCATRSERASNFTHLAFYVENHPEEQLGWTFYVLHRIPPWSTNDEVARKLFERAAAIKGSGGYYNLGVFLLYRDCTAARAAFAKNCERFPAASNSAEIIKHIDRDGCPNTIRWLAATDCAPWPDRNAATSNKPFDPPDRAVTGLAGASPPPTQSAGQRPRWADWVMRLHESPGSPASIARPQMPHDELL